MELIAPRRGGRDLLAAAALEVEIYKLYKAHATWQYLAGRVQEQLDVCTLRPEAQIILLSPRHGRLSLEETICISVDL